MFSVSTPTYVSTDLQISIFKAALTRLDARRETLCHCAVCGDPSLSGDLASIESDEVYSLYVQDYSLNRDDMVCPDCLKAINSDYQPADGADEKFENSRFGRNR